MFKKKLPRMVKDIENCKSRQQLNTVYKKLTTEILIPWKRDWENTLGRYNRFWDHRLDILSRNRTKQYRKAKATRKSLDWDHYKQK